MMPLQYRHIRKTALNVIIVLFFKYSGARHPSFLTPYLYLFHRLIVELDLYRLFALHVT
jgi:hypothetical protein